MLVHRENGKMFHWKDYNFEILFNKTSMFQDPVVLFTEKLFLRIHSEKKMWILFIPQHLYYVPFNVLNTQKECVPLFWHH